MKVGVKRSGLFILAVFVLPAIANAQVVINEIMYNPQGSDSGREWVELYNQGSADVTMVGGTVHGSWRIADSSNHTLTDPSGGTGRGSLVVPAGGYLIVASDPTEFISGEYAGGTYSVAKSSISLNNTGATISLIDGTGSTIDTVSYVSTQGGSDDGSSLQRQADGTWLAALPTPAAANSSTVFVAQSSGSSGSNQSSTSTSQTNSTQTSVPIAPSSSYVAPPTPDLYADAGADRTVIVGADTEFDASAYDKDQNLIDPTAVRFSWNFGDGQTAEGTAVLHQYDYPGKYVVTLTIARDKSSAIDEMTVSAEPAKLGFSALPDGGVEIDNLAGRDLDLSDWIVRAASGLLPARFMLPAHSLILSGSSMHIAHVTLGFMATSQSELEYPNGVTALTAGQTSAPTASVVPAAVPASAAPIATAPAKQTVHAVAASAEIPVSDDVSAQGSPVATDTATSETAAVADVGTIGGSTWWWIAAAALAAAAAGALIFAKKLGKKEWDIVEQK